MTGREYYERHGTEGDRIALWWYARMVRRLCRPGARVLEFGCGTGHLLRRLSADFDAFGYDASPYAREQSRRTAPRAMISDDWTSIEAASLDAVVTLHTLEHLPEPGPIVRGLVARMKVGAMLLAVVPNPDGLGHRLKGDAWFAYRDPTHCSLLSETEWRRVLAEAGLLVGSVRGDGMWDAPYVRGLPLSLQKALFGAPAALQVFSPIALPFLPPFLGECLIIRAYVGNSGLRAEG